MKNIKLTYLILFSIFIASCSFHLRGNQDLSSVLPEVQIKGISIHSELGRELNNALTNAKVSVLDESSILLNITKSVFSKRVLSLDSAGRANQYELSFNLSFSLIQKVIDENGIQSIIDLIPSQTITERREYLFDANLILAKADEEIRLNNDMRKAAMLSLVRRLMFSIKASSSKSKSIISK